MVATSTTAPILVVHGGSGELDRKDYSPESEYEHKLGLKAALEAGNKILADGGNALDAVVAAVAILEDNPLFNAGKGAVFNIAGGIELEASVAVSKAPKGTSLPDSRRSVAVTLVKHVKNPIKLARELYLDEEKCPHAFLAGEDTERIAKEKGLEIVDEKYFFTEDRWREHRRGLGLPDGLTSTTSDHSPAYPAFATETKGMSKGTVGAVALDAHGTLACATSTGGKTNKNVGRIGDTPSMGSGFWASTWPSRPTLWERLGINIFSSAASSIARHDGVAISGTGDGDFFVRNAATHEVVSRMKYLGEPVKQASHGVVDYLKTQNGMGGMIAVDSHGNYAMPLNCSAMFRGVISPRMTKPKVAIWSGDDLEEI